MTDLTEKKKMSKGCLIGLIVGGVVVVMLAALFTSCYIYKDDLMRYGLNKLLDSLKVQVMAGEIEGVDAERFSRMTDAFKVRLDSEPLDYTKFQRFAQSIQSMAASEGTDKEDISSLMDAMVEYFPEIEEFNPWDNWSDSPMADDSTLVTDSTAAE